jgi:hypothetical protein
MYAFNGNKLLCQFNTTSGQWINLNISSSADNTYELILEITTANHGQIFHQTANSFNQTVTLNYTDSYNVTVDKHPFYSTVWVSGTVDLYHNQTTKPSANPSIPEFPAAFILPIIATILAISFVIKKKLKL